ncbi:hypothetical protein SLA2020_313680 [Shorea laevis]
MWLSSSAQKEIDRISRNFIWGFVDGEKKLHLINWEIICQPKKQRGLGLRSAKDANLMAMSKLNWRLHTKEGKVWREGIKWIPKDGQHISFWSNHWIGQAPLNSILYGPFPPNISSISLASVLHEGAVEMDTMGYHLNSEIMSAIKTTLFSLVNHLHETFSWKGEANGLFSSASTHRILYSKSNVLLSDYGWIWKIPTMPKIKNFIWLLVHGRIKSMKFLYALSIMQDPICKVCNDQVETLDHICKGCPPTVMVLNRLLLGCLDMDHGTMDFGVWLNFKLVKRLLAPSTEFLGLLCFVSLYG